MPGELGELFGILIIIFYSLTVLNYILKFLNKRFRFTSSKNITVAKVSKFLMKFIVRNHSLFGFLAIGLVLVHFIIQAVNIGISITGIIAAVIMLAQIILGFYGKKYKPKNKAWLYAHRTIAVLLVVAIVIHIAL